MLNSEGKRDDDLLPCFGDEALPFTSIPHKEMNLKLIPQSTIVEVIPDVESLLDLDDERHTIVKDSHVELLLWNYCLNHFKFKVLQTLEKPKMLSKKLFTVMTPKCATCIYYAVHK